MRAEEVKRVVVVGAGTMGRGIAHVAAMAGCDVTLCDVRDDLVERGLQRIRTDLNRGIEKGKVTTAGRDAVLGRLRGATDAPEAAATADLIIEAVPEDATLKSRILSTVSQRAPEGALIATNTSSLRIGSLAGAVTHPSRFIGLHFFNPPHLMRLVEIVVGPDTASETVTLAEGLAARFGKDGIVVRDSPGFATSRLGLAIGLEAMRMLEEKVASAADIDRAMELGYNHPMGPLKLSDLVGLDVRFDISRALAASLDPVRFAPPGILVRKVAEGKLGRKSGEGFYRWTAAGPEPID
jgi:3-hydroxybutyryl-CoA dehydrogenase